MTIDHPPMRYLIEHMAELKTMLARLSVAAIGSPYGCRMNELQPNSPSRPSVAEILATKGLNVKSFHSLARINAGQGRFVTPAMWALIHRKSWPS
ncbi:MAG: hypothetical protein ACU85E_06540 [Gammaproteobacteria bacterium]